MKIHKVRRTAAWTPAECGDLLGKASMKWSDITCRRCLARKPKGRGKK